VLRISRSSSIAALLALAGCVPLPFAPPALTPTEDRAVRSTLAAATSTGSSISIPARPCPEHYARPEPGEQCKPIPCGGQCRGDQRCDEAALVPRCVDTGAIALPASP
jgi:hypothetical protein